MSKLLMLAVLVCACGSAEAADLEITPFQTRNQSPLVQIYGIPPQSSSDIVPTGKIQFNFNQDLSSNYTVHTSLHEQISLDGETYRLALSARYGVVAGWEAGIEVPYLIQGGGFLDSFVIEWHKVFALPQGGRDTVPKGRISYRYRKDGIRKLDMDSSSSGIGDISLTGGYQVYEKQDGGQYDRLALKASLKLPTGDSSYLRGSGGTDLALQLCGGMNSATEWGSLGIYGSLGALVMAGGDVLRDQHNPVAGIGTFGVGWGPTSWIAFKLQLNAATPLYHDSSLGELSGSSVLLVSGGTVKLPGGYLLDIGVGEDVAVATAPDVSFHLGLSKSF
ncbi:MAG TPA: DUF3187 family protein [Desulfuromonadales bacterium]|nr:DUF3187 family protein [Desulfuromonadales bacterium]